MVESMKILREACVERGKWVSYEDMNSSERSKCQVVNDLRKPLIIASDGDITDVFYNVVEIAGGRDEFVSVYDDSKMLAFIDVTADSPMALIRDVLRCLDEI